jgi:predicted aspartyl protease
MTGKVTNEWQATIPVRMGLPGSTLRSYLGVIDTGFNGYVTAPPNVIESLGLLVCGDTETELGDGREVFLPTYEAEVEWFSTRLVVPLLATEGGILLRMSLLRGSRLIVDVMMDGQVHISQLSRTD